MREKWEQYIEAGGEALIFLVAAYLLTASFPPHMRKRIRSEQEHKCAHPDCTEEYEDIQIHHRVPTSLNGNDSRENGVGLCPTHHEHWDKLALGEKVIFPGLPLAEAPKRLFRRRK